MHRILAPRHLRLIVLLLLILAVAAGCAREEEPVYREHLLAFGTLVDVTIYGVEPERAAQATAAVERDLEALHATWHAWEPSPLGRINEQLATTERFSVAPAVLPLIERAQELALRTDGLFDPAIGGLVRTWGFHGDTPTTPPNAEAIEALLAQRPSMADIEINGITLRSTNPAVLLDFGGFAKGHGVDVAIERLRELGIEHAIVNAGGDLRAIGRRGDRPWRIGIRDPRGPEILASVEMETDEALFTSGDYERYFEHEGVRYHHILDPRTGYPAEGATSATVIHANGAYADAAATALFVAGPERWLEIARALELEHAMLIDAEGTVHLTPAMAERLRFEVEPAPPTVVSEP
jgi:FAD:protein FMN transferase